MLSRHSETTLNSLGRTADPAIYFGQGQDDPLPRRINLKGPWNVLEHSGSSAALHEAIRCVCRCETIAYVAGAPLCVLHAPSHAVRGSRPDGCG